MEKRVIDLEGAELLSQGFFGKVYRLSDEQILKLYIGTAGEEQAKEEFEFSKKVFLLGIPCTIPFGVVDTEQGPGIIYERIDGGSLARNMAAHPEKLPEYMEAFMALAKSIWSVKVPEGILPDAKKRLIEKNERLRMYLPASMVDDYNGIISGLPDGDRFLHMDFHWCNVMLRRGECLLIDLPEASVGHPALDLSGIAHAYYLAPQREVIQKVYSQLFRIRIEDAPRIWNLFCEKYFEGVPEKVAAERRRAAELLAIPFVTSGSTAALLQKPQTQESRALREKELYEVAERFIENGRFLTGVLREWEL